VFAKGARSFAQTPTKEQQMNMVLIAQAMRQIRRGVQRQVNMMMRIFKRRTCAVLAAGVA
jgi:hypothetical protein